MLKYMNAGKMDSRFPAVLDDGEINVVTSHLVAGNWQQPATCYSSRYPPVLPLCSWWSPSHSAAPLWDFSPELQDPQISCNKKRAGKELTCSRVSP